MHKSSESMQAKIPVKNFECMMHGMAISDQSQSSQVSMGETGSIGLNNKKNKNKNNKTINVLCF